MNLDPSRWFVSFAGFAYDWMITREWNRILPNMLPLCLIGILGSGVWFGSGLNKMKLANWYMELGEQEIAAWEASWAPSVPTNSIATAGPVPEPALKRSEPDDILQREKSPEGRSTESAELGQPSISRFTEVLFQRVQKLAPRERAQFVIAAARAGRGAKAQSKQILVRIAPDDRSGYAPAHALLAEYYLEKFQAAKAEQQIELANTLRHHIRQAAGWERVPQMLLDAGSDLFWFGNEQDRNVSLSLLTQSAQKNPGRNLALAIRAKSLGKQRIYEKASSDAVDYFSSELARDPNNMAARLQLATTYHLQDRLDEAAELLQAGQRLSPSANLSRLLSENYRLKFVKTIERTDDGGYAANMDLLDAALREDPTNPLVVEEVAKLARVESPTPSDELLERMSDALASGQATTMTHAFLAEAHVLRKDLKSALPHLEQVVLRLPTGAQYLNNLAFILSEIQPARLQEALGYAERAVQIATSLQTPNAEYYDTLGVILSKLERHTEAVTAYEIALELASDRADFHRALSAEYRAIGQADMGQRHEAAASKLENQPDDTSEAPDTTH
jgi:tetratricopeptide (TPR) repeat protein